MWLSAPLTQSPTLYAYAKDASSSNPSVMLCTVHSTEVSIPSNFSIDRMFSVSPGINTVKSPSKASEPSGGNPIKLLPSENASLAERWLPKETSRCFAVQTQTYPAFESVLIRYRRHSKANRLEGESMAY